MPTDDLASCAVAPESVASAFRTDSGASGDGDTSTAWQPIETAPKDGTDILLSDGVEVTQGGWVAAVSMVGGAGWWSVAGDLRPTHWMAFPAPPVPVLAET
jgi:hypothetical protein